MRLLPLLTALLVMGALYLLVMQRPALIAFAGGEAAAVETGVPVPAETAVPVSVVVQRSTAQEVPTGIVLRGRTEAARQVELKAETAGLVISEPRRKGARVKAGDRLCQLDPGTRGAELAEARARLSEAQINERVAAELRDKGFAPDTRVLAARAALQAAEAGVERAQREIDRLGIHAPFDGLLETDAAEIGSLLQPGALCATVIQLDPIRLVGFVPETEVDRIAPGAEADARLATGRTVRGQVVFVGRSADPVTRTFRVDIEVANPDLLIRDGQSAEIVISGAGTRAHLLPASALTLDDAGRLGLRSAAEGVVAFHPVTVLRDTSDGVWLTGLPETLDVIVLGQEYVIEGSRVSVTLRESAQ